MSALLEPTTQILVKNGFSWYFLHETSNICYDEIWSLFGQIYFQNFVFSIFLHSPPQITENQQFQQQIGVLLEGRSKSHIESNSLRLAESVANSFYFTLNPRQLNYSKSKKSYNFFLGTSRKRRRRFR